MRIGLLLLAFAFGQPARGELEDYLIVFSADSLPYRPTKAHLFAAVVRVERAPNCPLHLVDLASISWLPATLKVRPFALQPEAGRNVPLDETLRVYLASGGCVCMWGPYRIRPELAEMFKARAAAVESHFRYKAPCYFWPQDVCDCVRAVEEMIDPRRRYIGVYGYGAAAASVLVHKCSSWMQDPSQCHPAVATLIGLDQFPLIRRAFGDDTSRLEQLRASFGGK